MEKRALIAIVLSLLVLIASQYLLAPPPSQKTPASEQAAVANAPAAQPQAQEAIRTAEAPVSPEVARPTAVTPAVPEAKVKVDTPLYSGEFSSRGGTITGWKLHKYQDEAGLDISLIKPGSPYAALAIGSKSDFSFSDVNFEVHGEDLELSESRPTGTLTFTYTGQNYSITRTYTFHHDTYYFDVEDSVSGLPDYQITLGSAFGITDAKASYGAHVGPVVLEGGDRENFKPGKQETAEIIEGNLKWIAVEDKYFFSAIVPKTKVSRVKVWSIDGASSVAFIAEAGIHQHLVYAGPKERDNLKGLGVGLEHTVDFGFFSIVAIPIFWLLKKINLFIGNYGWSIILLTFVVRIPFLPLMHKAQKSMKRMAELQPKIQALKEQYKKDPQKMNAEMMNLYRKHKVNPVGGCLPLLVQLPVFIALYRVLMVSIELRMAPWAFWIHDLSAKDPFYVLPIVMGLSMFLQQKLTPTAGDPKQQKMLMFMMPVVITFVCLNISSGLVLYIFASNILSIVQQIVVNRGKKATA